VKRVTGYRGEEPLFFTCCGGPDELCFALFHGFGYESDGVQIRIER
jgi:hypothetical protein